VIIFLMPSVGAAAALAVFFVPARPWILTAVGLTGKQQFNLLPLVKQTDDSPAQPGDDVNPEVLVFEGDRGPLLPPESLLLEMPGGGPMFELTDQRNFMALSHLGELTRQFLHAGDEVGAE